MKKDIYITITAENVDHLYELPGFICPLEYTKQEKDFYKDDLGKIETYNCNFRFIKHVNVKCDTKNM